jgi:predicted phosphoserine aminotransferase
MRHNDDPAVRLDPAGRFFLPGPTEVHPDVLAAQSRPMIPHRGAEMEELIARIQTRLRSLFRTTRPVFIAPCSATGFMEAAVRNGVRKRVLSLVNGAFSERFYQIARSCGLDATAIEVPSGAGHEPELLAEALQLGDYDAVTVVHSETSTGVLNPIAGLAAAAHAFGDVALLVDSVSGIGGAPLETDAWGLDLVLTASQKALAMPPGLALCTAQESVMSRARQSERRGYYFDLLEFEKFILKNQTPTTPAESLLYAMDVQLERIAAEGLEARWARHAAMASRTWEWADEMRADGIDVSVLAPRGMRSPTVTCLTLPDGITGPEVASKAAERGYTIAPGYGTLRERTIRIGHMGDHTVPELEELLSVLGELLG